MTETFQLFVGIDWATEAHQVCALNPHGEVLGERRVSRSGNDPSPIGVIGQDSARIRGILSVGLSEETPSGSTKQQAAPLSSGSSVLSPSVGW
jgi:hypothetical protein